MFAQDYDILPGIKRSQIKKCRNLVDAYQLLDVFSTQHFVFLGEVDESHPYWIVDANIAAKLENLGYERA